MTKKSSTIFVFIFLLFVTIVVFFFSKIPVFQPVEYIFTFLTTPIQHMVYQGGRSSEERDQQIQKLTDENGILRKKLVDQKTLLTENSALKDQFQTTHPVHTQLLPARVLGAPGFIPGISQPEILILDKGKQDGITPGSAVIFKDNVIGEISRVSYTISAVSLLSNSPISFTAKTVGTQAVGVVSSSDEGLSLKNVLLSQRLQRGDLVVTKGNIDTSGKGFPPDLVVGKIIDIDKKPSALFQTAQVKSLVDVSSLSTVFIIPIFK